MRKEVRIETVNAIIVIIDLDLPLLLVNIAERFSSNPINLNEYILFNIEL